MSNKHKNILILYDFLKSYFTILKNGIKILLQIELGLGHYRWYLTQGCTYVPYQDAQIDTRYFHQHFTSLNYYYKLMRFTVKCKKWVHS